MSDQSLTWAQFAQALVTTCAELFPATTITIHPKGADGPWVQALILDGTTDTRLVAHKTPDDDEDQWRALGFDDPHGAWEVVLEWPTPTRTLADCVALCVAKLRTGVTDPNELVYEAWSDGYHDDTTTIPPGDCTINTLPIAHNP